MNRPAIQAAMTQTDPNAQRLTVDGALKLAAEHQGAKRFERAESVLKQILTQRPNYLQAVQQLSLLYYAQGNLSKAIAILEQGVQAHPTHATFHANMGEMYRRLGNPEKAVFHGKQAVALQPDYADAANNTGIALFDTGHYAEAIEFYDTAIRLKPRYAEALSNRGNAKRVLKRLDEAEDDYKRALAINPNYAEALNNMGSAVRDLGRLDEAIALYRRSLTIRADYFDCWNNLALAYREKKDYDAAYAAIAEALRHKPNNADSYTYRAATLIDQKKWEQAGADIQRALSLNPRKAEAHNLGGRIAMEAGDAEGAIASYRRALHLKPDLSDAWNNIGNLHKEFGRIDEAMEAYERALSLAPEQVGTYLNLADTKKFLAADDRHLLAMEGFARHIERLTDEKQMQLQFALGKAYDDLKRPDDAFRHLSAGNVLKRKTIDYDRPRVEQFFVEIASVFTPELVQRMSGGGAQTQLPIFVLGMPRSGTTLIEQVLASHPMVRGGGELRELLSVSERVVGADKSAIHYPAFMNAISHDDLRRIGEAYAARLQTYHPGAERITDKMPSNFYFAGLIHLAMPNAKIIHSQRNAIDTCWSCYTKLFSGEQIHTYDLREIGLYYRRYHALMQHWREVLPAGAFLDVAYEDVVADMEGQARRMLEFCGLEWDPAVLKYYESDRPVKTASVTQVRQPIYNSSVERWRVYERHLGPLIEALGPELAGV
jgi:tetratricopeptide (TPR) repeat protein